MVEGSNLGGPFRRPGKKREKEGGWRVDRCKGRRESMASGPGKAATGAEKTRAAAIRPCLRKGLKLRL